MLKLVAISAVACLIAFVIYTVRKNSEPVSVYVWDSFQTSDKEYPLFALGGTGLVFPVGAKGPDGKWVLGSTITNAASPHWGEIGVPPTEGTAFTASEIWYLRARDDISIVPLRAAGGNDKQLMFNGIPVCYSASGAFGAGTNKNCPPQSAVYGTFAPLADVTS